MHKLSKTHTSLYISTMPYVNVIKPFDTSDSFESLVSVSEGLHFSPVICRRDIGIALLALAVLTFIKFSGSVVMCNEEQTGKPLPVTIASQIQLTSIMRCLQLGISTISRILDE